MQNSFLASMASSSSSNSTNSTRGLCRPRDSGKDEVEENISEDSHSTAPPAIPALVSYGGDVEDGQNGDNEDNEDKEESPQFTPPYKIPIQLERNISRSSCPPPTRLRTQERMLDTTVRHHSRFVQRLANGLREAVSDHVETCNQTCMQLVELESSIIHQLERCRDSHRYFVSSLHESFPRASRMSKKRRLNSTSLDEPDVVQLSPEPSSCGPECNSPEPSSCGPESNSDRE